MLLLCGPFVYSVFSFAVWVCPAMRLPRWILWQ